VPISLFRDFAVRRPGIEEVASRFRRSFTHPDLPKSQRPEPLRLEVVLPPDRAARGGLLELTVPVFYPCSSCHGAARSAPSLPACAVARDGGAEEWSSSRLPAGCVTGAVLALQPPGPRNPRALPSADVPGGRTPGLRPGRCSLRAADRAPRGS
jgi:hypothetical protein